jgi:hypothetical protein
MTKDKTLDYVAFSEGEPGDSALRLITQEGQFYIHGGKVMSASKSDKPYSDRVREHMEELTARVSNGAFSGEIRIRYEGNLPKDVNLS